MRIGDQSHENTHIAECSLIKVGRTLVVGEVSLYSEGVIDLVAHVVGTYSIPPYTSERSENIKNN